MSAVAFLRSLVCAWHVKIPKLFIFLTPPYGAVTYFCLRARWLKTCKTQAGVYKRDPHQTMSGFCYFFCRVGFVDATVCILAQEPTSHQLRSTEILLIRPKCECALGTLKSLGGEKKKKNKNKGGPGLLCNATINCQASSPMHWWLNVLLNCADLWGHLADFICYC